MEQLGSNEGPDNVIGMWRAKAWKIVKKASDEQLALDQFQRLFTEFIQLRPDLRDQEHFSLLIKVMPKWQESDKSTFSKFRELITEFLREALGET